MCHPLRTTATQYDSYSFSICSSGVCLCIQVAAYHHDGYDHQNLFHVNSQLTLCDVSALGLKYADKDTNFS
jgi:hypothetical protein